MPILDKDQEAGLDATAPAAPPHFPKPQEPEKEPFPSAEEFSPALGRSTQIGQLMGDVERMFDPHPPAVPGYNPIPDIPQWVPNEWRDEYLHLSSPSAVAKKTEEMQQRVNDQQVIHRMGGWGVAASMGMGLTDPINLATMAIAPEAAPTRMGNAIRWGLANGAITAGQELVNAGIGPDTSLKGSALNVGANAILGGVLGGVLPHVPRGTLSRLAEDVHADIHAPNPEVPAPPGSPPGTPPTREEPAALEASNVAGPVQRSVLDDTEASFAAVDKAAEEGVELPGEPRRPLTYVPPRPEGPTVPRPGTTPEVEPHRMSLTEALAVMKGADSKSFGLSAIEAAQQGLDPEAIRTARFGSRRVFTKGGMGFDEAAQMLHEHGYPVTDEQGHYSPNALLDALDNELRGNKQYSPHADDYLTGIAEHERASEVADREVAEEQRAKEEAMAKHEGAEEAEGFKRGDFVRVTEKGDEGNARIRSIHRYGPEEPWMARVRHEGGYEASFELSKLEKLSEEEIAKGRAEAEAAQEAADEAAKERAAIREEAHALPGEPLFEPETFEGEVPPAVVNPAEASTMGAAAAGPTKEQLTTARGGRFYTRTIGRVATGARLIESPSTKVRQLLTELANIPGILKGHLEGMKAPDPVERQLWREMEARQAAGIASDRAFYRKYQERLAKTGEDPLSFREFQEAVGNAARRSDQHPIPEVGQASAADWRKLTEETKGRMEKVGMLEKDKTPTLFAPSYLTRLFDMPKIRAARGQFIEFLRGEFIRQGVDPTEATDVAHRVLTNISASERGQLDLHAFDGIVPKSGRTKARVLAINDDRLEPWLVSNIAQIRSAYLHSVMPELLLREKGFDRDLKAQFDEIRDEYGHLTEQARAAGDQKRMDDLAGNQAKDLTTLAALRDMLYGNYGIPKDPGSFSVRAGRFLRALNVSRMLGGATFKHFPDVANVMLRYGAGNTFEVMAKLATSLDAIKMGYSQAKAASVAVDMTMNVAAAALWDAASHSQYAEQRFMRRLNRAFTIATLETPWITGIQMVAGTLAHHDILKTAERVAAGFLPGKYRMAQYAAAGLDRPMLERIAAAAAQHGQQFNGIRFGMIDQWSDRAAAQALQSAVAREAHGVTMRPGIADKPLVMSKEYGKFLLQFRSFEFAASRIVGLPMLQGLAHGDIRAVTALMAQFGMATAGYVAFQKATGNKVEVDPKKLAMEVLDRTNLLGWTSSAIYPALHMVDHDLGRWYDKDPASLFGPSVELGSDVYKSNVLASLRQAATGTIGHEKALPFKRSDLHFVRKIAPYNQLFYFRRGLDNLEDSLGDQFGLRGKSLEQYREARERGEQPE